MKTFDDAAIQIATEIAEVLVKKQKDYGPKNILNCPVGARLGVIVRLHDKISRLSNLLKSNKTPSNESIEDTWLDIVGYGLIGMMLERDLFKLPIKREK